MLHVTMLLLRGLIIFFPFACASRLKRIAFFFNAEFDKVCEGHTIICEHFFYDTAKILHCKKPEDFTVKYLASDCQFTCRYFLRASTYRIVLEIKIW